MKLLFITEFFPADSGLVFTGGVEAYSYYLTRELAKSNEVVVIARRLGNQPRKSNFENGLVVNRVGLFGNRVDSSWLSIPSRFAFFLAAFAKGLSIDFDIVQGNNFVTYLPAFLIGFLKSKPTVVWYPDVFINKWISLTGLFSGLIGEIAERISIKLPWSMIIALSLQTKEKLIRVGVKSNKIVTVYGGVERETINKVKAKKSKIFTICCISRLVSYKRVDLLIKAAKKLESKFDFRIVIIGDGPLKNNLLGLIKDLELANKISIKSDVKRDKLIEILKSSHLFSLQSEVEGFGLVVIEAAAAGVPYVVTDIPVLREITKDGIGGKFFRMDDEDDLVKKIIEFHDDLKSRTGLEREVLKLADYYSWEKIGKEFEVQYKKVM